MSKQINIGDTVHLNRIWNVIARNNPQVWIDGHDYLLL